MFRERDVSCMDYVSVSFCVCERESARGKRECTHACVGLNRECVCVCTDIHIDSHTGVASLGYAKESKET